MMGCGTGRRSIPRAWSLAGCDREARTRCRCKPPRIRPAIRRREIYRESPEKDRDDSVDRSAAGAIRFRNGTVIDERDENRRRHLLPPTTSRRNRPLMLRQGDSSIGRRCTNGHHSISRSTIGECSRSRSWRTDRRTPGTRSTARTSRRRRRRWQTSSRKFHLAITQTITISWRTTMHSRRTRLAPLFDDIGGVCGLLERALVVGETVPSCGSVLRAPSLRLHHDKTNLLIAQVGGRKRIILFPACRRFGI